MATVVVDASNRELNELLDRLAQGEPELVLEREGRPVAVLRVTGDDEERRARFAMFEEIWEHNKDVPPEVIEAQVNAAVREVRAAESASRAR
jgi:antitoxin (DNA-binding transcriptional repressor) of toxin-antitoxin stability system